MIERINAEACKGCGSCQDACPADVIRLDEETKKAKVVYLEDCMTCYNCERYCPEGAIFVHPFMREQPHVW